MKKNLLRNWIFGIISVIAGYLLLVGIVELVDQFYKGTWKTYTYNNSPLSNYRRNEINTIVTDNQGLVWIGTEEGLYSISPDGIWSTYTSENSPMVIDRVEELVIDKLGNVWVGTYFYLYVFNPNSLNWEKIENISDVRALTVDNSNQVWVGTLDGVYVINDTYDVVENYTSDNSGLVDDEISVLAIDRFNQVWIGTERDGISVYNPDGIWITYQASDTGLRSNEINCFFFDPHDMVWVGTDYGGLNMLDATGNWIQGATKSKYHIYSVADIVSDNQGNIWVSMGSWGGNILVNVNGSHSGGVYTNDNSRLPHYVNTLMVDSNNRLWMGTSYGGLQVIELNEGLPKIAPYNWVVAREIIRLPMELFIQIVEEIKRYFGYFWYGLIPIIVMFTISGIGFYFGAKQNSRLGMLVSAFIFLITVAFTLFFCNFMFMALFAQG